MTTRRPEHLLIVSHVLVQRCSDQLYLQGGFGRFLDAIARRYERVCLLTCCRDVDPAPDEYRLRADNVTVLGLRPFADGNRLKRYGSMLISALQCATILPRALRRSDVLHARLPSVVGAVGALAGRFSSKPTFLYLAGDWEAGLRFRSGSAPVRLLASVVQWGLEFLVDDQLTFVSGRPLTEKFGGPSDRVVSVVTTSIDARHVVSEDEAVARAFSPPRELLFVGVVWRMKGVHVLLRSLKELRERDFDLHLKIIGSMSDEGRWIREEMRAHGLAPFVDLVPAMPWDRLMAEYEKSDVFVMPSLEGRGETGPKVVLEAMARGLPVVASSVGFVPRLVEHRKSGWIVPPGRPEAITEAVAEICRDPDLRKRLAREGVRTARRYQLETLVDDMVRTVASAAAA